MISCPLCQAQNDPDHRACLRCGGPLNAPRSARDHHHTALAPSQTPRQLKGSLRPLWMRRSFGLISGAIWLLIGATLAIAGPLTSDPAPGLILGLVGAIAGVSGALTLLFALRSVQRELWLLRYGAQARGRFTGARVNDRKRRDGRAAIVLSWAFEDAQGKTWQGDTSTFNPPFGWQSLPNQPVTVLYDPARPKASLPLSLVPVSLSSPPQA